MSSDKKVKKENFNFGTITDIQGNSYRTINLKGGILGLDQEWFADNLNVSCFRNSDPIQQAQQHNDWLEVCEKGIPAWCYYEENENFGKMYNLAAIMDPRGLAPEGYQIPDYIDFSILGFNAQEYAPQDKNILSYSDKNYRLESIGLSAGALKLMAKEHWKKKGKNIGGLNIIGCGSRGGSAWNNGFHGSTETCYLWLRPSGWNFMNSESDKNLGWIEFNLLKLYLPEFSINQDSISNAVVSDDYIKISTAEFEVYEKEMMLNGLRVDRIKLSNLYPFKKNDETHVFDYNHAKNCLFDYFQTGSRNGIRVATFASGKNQVWYTLSERTNGAYVRPFKYL